MADEPNADPNLNPDPPPADPPAGDPPADPPADPPENWYSDDWRDKMSGGDEKLKERLGRFNDPGGVLTSYLAAEQKLSSGEARGELPENYTDEQLATYREANGIPAEVGDYFKDMPEGLVIGDDDKEIFDVFGQAMHDINVKPEVMHALASTYYAEIETQQAKQAEADENQRMATEDSLRVLWPGDEYRGNISTLDTYLESAPEEVSDALLSARAADGTPLMTKPEVLKFFADRAREENPWSTPVPNEGDMTSLAEEKEKLREQSKFPNSPYWKGVKDADGNTAGQARMLKIIEHEKRMETRAA